MQKYLCVNFKINRINIFLNQVATLQRTGKLTLLIHLKVTEKQIYLSLKHIFPCTI
jgi:hypothetical protein